MFQVFTFGNTCTDKKKIITRNCQSSKYKLSQSLHHFIGNSDWSVEQLRSSRLNKIKKKLKGNAITVVIDKTGDRKKGRKTDYVARQYLGSIGKIDSGIVSVNAYGVYCNISFPLIVKAFKPKGTLRREDKYQTKIELAAEIIAELMNEDFNIKLVLADSLYGESSQFLSKLAEYNLDYVVVIRSNHAVWLPFEQSVRANKWCKIERTFSNQNSESRYIRGIIYGKKRAITYWEITTDPATMPDNSNTFVMTNIWGNLKKTLAELYGLTTWVEYGFR